MLVYILLVLAAVFAVIAIRPKWAVRAWTWWRKVWAYFQCWRLHRKIVRSMMRRARKHTVDGSLPTGPHGSHGDHGDHGYQDWHDDRPHEERSVDKKQRLS